MNGRVASAARNRVLACSLFFILAGCWHWVKWEGPASASPHCAPSRVIRALDTVPQSRLTGFDMFIAKVSTPFKRRGLSGWRETYCEAYAEGLLVRDAQHSTDGFWTMDLRLSLFAIALDTVIPTKRFIRIEVEPRTRANTEVSATPPRQYDCIEVSGIVVIDTDRNFLEIHPDTGYSRIAGSDSAKRLRALSSERTTGSASLAARCVPQ
jgi:hypothetical protein